MKRILLIGAGNLGKRHLQSLKSSKFDLEIMAVEPSAAAADAAQEAYEATGRTGGIKRLEFSESTEQLDFRPDVAIIATPATGRLELMASAIELGARLIILEKVAFNSVGDIDEATALVKASGAKVWVNCPRRLNPLYQELKSYFAGTKIAKLEVIGANYGLACNFVHFVDLFAYLIGERNYEISLTGIDTVEQSKRNSYVEFGGIISGAFSSGVPFSLTCSRDDSGISVKVRIVTDDGNVVINEVGGDLSYLDYAGEVTKQQPYSQPYQSQLTGPLVDELLSSGGCGLTDFYESMALHLPFISAAYELYAAEFGSNPRETVPIT